MTDTIDKIISEIERHKGVILPDAYELGAFASALFTGACELVDRPYTMDMEYQFIENKYKQVLEAVQGFYVQYPARRQFLLRVKWEELEGLQYRLAAVYKKKDDI